MDPPIDWGQGVASPLYSPVPQKQTSQFLRKGTQTKKTIQVKVLKVWSPTREDYLFQKVYTLMTDFDDLTTIITTIP